MGTRVSASLLRSLCGWEEQEENYSDTINKQGVLGLVTRSMKTYETVASIAGADVQLFTQPSNHQSGFHSSPAEINASSNCDK